MLKTILAGVRGPHDDHAAKPTAPRSAAEMEQLKVLTECFPIGKKLRYIPDYKTEIIFDTLLVAYCIDGRYVYSREAVEVDAEGYPTAFLVGESGERVPVVEVKEFQFLVPDTSDLEMRLDYARRAMLGRGRQFNRGNAISLMSNAGARGVATLDTEVVKQVLLKEGPYAHAKMVLLAPEARSLAFSDQRGKTRTKTCVPVVMTTADGPLRGPCTIVDVSDNALRVRVRDGDTMPQLSRDEGVLLDFDLGEGERHFTIRGAVIRRAAETCVVRLESVRKEGRFASLTHLDLLELKAGLLNYGK